MPSWAPCPIIREWHILVYRQVLGISANFSSESHVAPGFVNTFGETLQMLRQLFQTSNPASQPFLLTGSGSLGWDLVAANLVERGDDALVLNTGYFGDSFASCLEAYGVRATQLRAPIGDVPAPADVEQALKAKKYKIVTVTHVDTSTGVLSDIKAVAQLVRRVSPDTLVVVDGVCSVGCEDLSFDAWDLDVVVTASQKAIGSPPGMSITMCSGRAMERLHARIASGGAPATYYASMAKWLPIMQNYEARKPSYFATPATQLVNALHTALTQLLTSGGPDALSRRMDAHARVSERVKATIADLGLTQLASKPENQARAMTTIKLPQGVTPPDVLPGLTKRGVIFAGGLHRDIASTYIRFGHMGTSVMDPARGDIDRAVAALKEVFAEIK